MSSAFVPGPANIDLLTPDMKMEWRIDSLSMVKIIIPNVLSFLYNDSKQRGFVFLF